MTPLDLLELREGDPDVTKEVNAIIQRHVRRHFKGASERHDVGQAAMVEALEKLERGELPPPGRVTHWIINCANNAVRRARTQQRRRRVTDPYESQLGGHNLSSLVRRRAELHYLQQLLRAESTKTRALVVEAALGSTHQEIADEQGRSVLATRAKLSRTRVELRRKLDGQARLRRLQQLARRLSLPLRR